MQFEQLRVQNEKNYYGSFHDFRFISKPNVLSVCVSPIQDDKNPTKSMLNNESK